jgi:hypothetical protein
MKAALAQIHAAQMQLASEFNPVAARGLVGTIATLESRFVERFGER